jgi:hypothetical protein
MFPERPCAVGSSEQAFSVDGGRTWETNWITTYTRVSGD